MPKLLKTLLDLDRCPHCNVDKPTLAYASQCETHNYKGEDARLWRFYACKRCGGVVTGASDRPDAELTALYPAIKDIDQSIPERAHEYLNQAINSLSSPAGAVMLAASAVDAMLKSKGLKDGTLYSRIDKAAKEHLITADMAEWAHKVRLDANEQRHSDEDVAIPTTQEAKQTVDFAIALGEFMFVLPAKVRKGIKGET